MFLSFRFFDFVLDFFDDGGLLFREDLVLVESESLFFFVVEVFMDGYFFCIIEFFFEGGM